MSRSIAATGPGWRNVPVHRDVDHRSARWVFRLILGVAVAIVPLAIYLLQTMSFVQTSYAIEEARGREVQLVEWEHRLTIEKDALESLPEVEKSAGARLGLEHAPASHVVVVAKGEINAPHPPHPLHPR